MEASLKLPVAQDLRLQRAMEKQLPISYSGGPVKAVSWVIAGLWEKLIVWWEKPCRTSELALGEQKSSGDCGSGETQLHACRHIWTCIQWWMKQCFILSTSLRTSYIHTLNTLFLQETKVTDQKVYMSTSSTVVVTFLHLSSADCLTSTLLHLFLLIPTTLTRVVRTTYWTSVFQKGFERSTISPHCWVPIPMTRLETLTGKAQPWGGREDKLPVSACQLPAVSPLTD